MKPIFITLFILATILSACTPTSNPFVTDISTPTIEPVATTLAIAEPTLDKNVIGTWYDTYTVSLAHSIIIRNINGSYQMTTLYGDGSGGTQTLVVKILNGEERLYENPDNVYGDYMVIKSNGNLAFYDDQGFTYEDQPTTSIQSIVNTSTPTQIQSSGNNTSWFKGGTLHKATIREWRLATYANRLATSADFIAATQNVDYGDMGKFKQMATDLETCISTAASGGDVDDEQVTFVSSLCLVQLFP